MVFLGKVKYIHQAFGSCYFTLLLWYVVHNLNILHSQLDLQVVFQEVSQSLFFETWKPAWSELHFPLSALTCVTAPAYSL